MSKWIKLWFIGLFGILMLSVSGLSVYANTENTPPGVDGSEIIEKRTENSKTFQNLNGGTSVFLSFTPLHYQDAKGKWREIDTTLEDSAGEVDDDGETYGFKSTRNIIDTYLPKHNRGWAQVRNGKYRVSFKLVSNGNHNFTRHNDGIEANELFNHCDFKLSVGRGLIKEDIILKNNTAPKSFEYVIRLQNLDIIKNKDGSFALRNAKGKPVFNIPKFVMYDSNHEISEEIVTSLEKRDRGYRLIVTPSQSWLNDPKRAFPVVVDPTITIPPINSAGAYRTYYIPSQNYLQINPPPDNVNIGGNSPDSVLWKGTGANPPYGLPYDTNVKAVATVGGNGGGYISVSDAWFQIVDWNPQTNAPGSLGNILPQTNIASPGSSALNHLCCKKAGRQDCK